MKKVEFTDTELETLAQLLDIAVKAGGIQVAEAAAVLFKKLQTAEEVDAEEDI